MVWRSLYMYVSGVYIRTSVYVCIHTWCGVCSRVSVDISVCVFVCVRDVCICGGMGRCVSHLNQTPQGGPLAACQQDKQTWGDTQHSGRCSVLVNPLLS